MEPVVLTSRDGAAATVQVFEGKPGRPAVLVWPAMGVPGRYYAPLGRALQAAGLHAVLCELRGTASSTVRPARAISFGMREVLELDYTAAVGFARARFPGSPIVFWGHSLGGQLCCLHQALAQPPQRASAMVLTATCSVYYRAYPFPGNLAVLVGTQLASGIGRVLGHYPGQRLGFGGHQARGMIRDWAHQGRTGRYAPLGMEMDLELALRRVATPTLAVSLAGDRFAPGSAVDHLVAKLAPRASERWHLTAAELGLRRVDHFSWAKQPDALVARVDGWLADRVVAA